MAQNYTLTDNVDETFKFQLRDKKYIMRYPLTEEIDHVKEISSKIEEAEKNEDDEEAKKLSSELEGFIYQFISPDGHETPVKDALAKENTRVMRNFNTMIKAELAIQ